MSLERHKFDKVLNPAIRQSRNSILHTILLCWFGGYPVYEKSRPLISGCTTFRHSIIQNLVHPFTHPFFLQFRWTTVNACRVAIVNMKVFSVLIAFAASALAASRTTAPSGALVVGSGQKYTTSK